MKSGPGKLTLGARSEEECTLIPSYIYREREIRMDIFRYIFSPPDVDY